ncbi:MAG: carboxylating nicotinate-nucleotide diphosphorylase [Nanoarchaeota archaeon]
MRHRANLILEFWDRSRELTLENLHYKKFVTKFYNFLLNEDAGLGDITTDSMIKKNEKILAKIVAKENGVAAGLEELEFLNQDLELRRLKNDGDKIYGGDVLAEMEGQSKKILERERTSLNFLQRMSGIATLTNTINKNLGGNIKVAATRKTLWGSIDKKAVSVGGGITHRLNLSDGILIKDNHLGILQFDMEKALKSAIGRSRYVEIEVENKKDALRAAKIIRKLGSSSLFAIMFDKIRPITIKSIIKELKMEDFYEHILFEASGNITPKNLTDYSNCGVDIISMGCLTNSSKVLNMSQEIMR